MIQSANANGTQHTKGQRWKCQRELLAQYSRSSHIQRVLHNHRVVFRHAFRNSVFITGFMIRFIKKHWPLIVASGVLWATITVLLILSIRRNQGHLVYALDDTYIHMSMAKNFAQHGIWSVNNYGYTSSSSSLLWTLLLSLIYFLFGVNDVSPLILNLVFGTLLVFGVYLLLRKYSMQPFFILLVLMAIIFFTPLPTLIFCGLEHIIHALLTILFVFTAAKILSDAKPTSKEHILLLITAPLLTVARYEGLFLVFIVCVLFAVRKRLGYSFLLGGLAIIPIALYGVISISHGWYILPNSVILKSNLPSFSIIGLSKFLYHFIARLVVNKDILILLSAALLLLILHFNKKKVFWETHAIMLAIFIATTLLHMLFANAGWFFRYEAYLVAFGLFAIGIGMRDYLPEKLPIVFEINLIPKYVAITLFIIIVILPLAERGAMSLLRTPQATTNIYEQQYQMGLFLRRFYHGESVAANDIGAINYLADIRCLDLAGLGSIEVADAKMSGGYSTQRIYDFAKQKETKIAIVYEYWFKQYGGIPLAWIKAGYWIISNNVVCGGDTVSFYTVDPSKKDNLIANLKTFSSYLPENVVQSGEYTK